MLSLLISTLPHKHQRYPTCGDWQWRDGSDGGKLIVTVSELPDWRMEACVAVHELVEALLCRSRGVSEHAVDAFDQAYNGPASGPGDDPRAPYYREHQFATKVERLLVEEFGLDWDRYEAAIADLFEGEPK